MKVPTRASPCGTRGKVSLDYIRRQIVGRDLVFASPFGPRHMFYADYTASGRALAFVEKALFEIQKSCANTHTEDDFSGKHMTRLLHDAERRIKRHVNAGPGGKLFAVGSGSTGALKKLQEIIGVYVPPVTREEPVAASVEGACSTRTVNLSRLEALRAGYFRRAEREARRHERQGAVRFIADRVELEALKSFCYARTAPAARPKNKPKA